MRRLQAWPTWLLRAILRFDLTKHLWTDAFIEIHERAIEEANAAADAVARVTGPYRCSPPLGFH